MILETREGLKIDISDTDSELDIQFELVMLLKSMGVRCSQNKGICIIRTSSDNNLEYWKEEKIKKQTSKKLYVDILAIKGNKACIIEMKKSENPSKKQRGYIGSQIEQYKTTGFHVILCKGRKGFSEVIDYFK